jgi:hypothetical protein
MHIDSLMACVKWKSKADHKHEHRIERRTAQALSRSATPLQFSVLRWRVRRDYGPPRAGPIPYHSRQSGAFDYGGLDSISPRSGSFWGSDDADF